MTSKNPTTLSNLLAGLTVALMLTSGCGGGSESSSSPVPPPEPPPTRTGTLTISVLDPIGRPVADARVSIYDTPPATIGTTGASGMVTFASVPPYVVLTISHDFGHDERAVDVAQRGATLLTVTLQAVRPRPTVALLPVEIRPGSINTARDELVLQIAVAASASSPFMRVLSPEYSQIPSLGLVLGDENTDARRDCVVLTDTFQNSACASWGDSNYTVSVANYVHDTPGTIPMPAPLAATRSAILVLDQSRRVASLDPGNFRVFAARRVIERLLSNAAPRNLSVAGLAGLDTNPEMPLLLPQQPLWSPLANSSIFSADPAVLTAAVGMLEPLVGGSAPVYAALQAAAALAAAQAPSRDSAVIAMLGGDDTTGLTATQQTQALASLRQQRDSTGVRSILIAAPAAVAPSADHHALAELATALRAPTIALGFSLPNSGRTQQSWASGSFAAFDLAGDLIAGTRLPTLSGAFRVRARNAGAFPPGATLRGVVYVDSELCPFECDEIAIQFAVKIP